MIESVGSKPILQSPPDRDPRKVRRRDGAAWVWGAILLLTIAVGGLLGIPKFYPNSELYILLAMGHPESVSKPFAARLLHPFVVKLFIAFGLTRDVAFAAVATLSLVLLFVAVRYAIRSLGPERFAWPLVLFCPLILQYYRTAYMNDLFHAALLAVLWLAFLRRMPLVLPALFALAVCRESTVLVAFVLLLYFGWQRRFRYAVAVGLTLILGFWIVAHLTVSTSHNIHNISTMAYIAEKTGWNLLANWAGLRLWRPTFAWPCVAPIFRTTLPILRDQATVCDWTPQTIIDTWTNFFGIFSLSFAFIGASFRAKSPQLRDRLNPVLVIAGYGLLAGVVGTFTGTATFRLIGYAWPLLLIVVPVCFGTVLSRVSAKWLWAHVAIMWIGVAIPDNVWMKSGFCLVVVGLNILAFQRVRRSLADCEPYQAQAVIVRTVIG